MQNLLATNPDINGVWVQDGMAAGAWRSIMESEKSAAFLSAAPPFRVRGAAKRKTAWRRAENKRYRFFSRRCSLS